MGILFWRELWTLSPTHVPKLDDTVGHRLFTEAAVGAIVHLNEPPGQCVAILHGGHAEST
jgi:hypothetical protein